MESSVCSAQPRQSSWVLRDCVGLGWDQCLRFDSQMLNHMLVCVYPGIRNFPHSALGRPTHFLESVLLNSSFERFCLQDNSHLVFYVIAALVLNVTIMIISVLKLIIVYRYVLLYCSVV